MLAETLPAAGYTYGVSAVRPFPRGRDGLARVSASNERRPAPEDVWGPYLDKIALVIARDAHAMHLLFASRLFDLKQDRVLLKQLALRILAMRPAPDSSGPMSHDPWLTAFSRKFQPVMLDRDVRRAAGLFDDDTVPHADVERSVAGSVLGTRPILDVTTYPRMTTGRCDICRGESVAGHASLRVRVHQEETREFLRLAMCDPCAAHHGNLLETGTADPDSCDRLLELLREHGRFLHE